MQQSLIPERCDRCGQPVRPGDPVMRTASVDLDGGGHAVASPVRTVHLADGCRDSGGSEGGASDAA